MVFLNFSLCYDGKKYNQYHLQISQSKALKAVRGISMENVYDFRVIMDSGRSSNPSQNLLPEAVRRIGFTPKKCQQHANSKIVIYKIERKSETSISNTEWSTM